MRIAICEDEVSQQELLKKYLQEWEQEKNIQIDIQIFDSAENFLFSWEEDKAFDLLILDIEMGTMSGMELAAWLRKQEEEIPLLFVTGYESYMSQGYEVAALHYLLKPLQKEKFFSVLERLQREKKAVPKLTIQTESEILLLTVNDIWYLEADRHKCTLHTARNVYQLRQSISAMAALLADKRELVQCHRSYLVNLQHISAITKTELIMDDQTRIPVSRSALKAVNEAFKRNYGL